MRDEGLKRSELVCYIRKKICIQTPEELVRQHVVKTLCEKRGFPASLCGLEISVSSLLKGGNVSRSAARRRIDILFFRQCGDDLRPRPFFLIECKARFSQNTAPVQRQVLGYRALLGPIPFVSIASSSEIVIWSKCGGIQAPTWYRGGIANGPSWEELLLCSS